MLDLALKAIAKQLNEHVHRKFDLDEDVVVLSAPFDADGGSASQLNNKIVVFLANIHKDSFPHASERQPVAMDGANFLYAPPLYLNLYVMIGAYFDSARYADSLRFLSCAVSCFQAKPMLDQNNTPDLGEGIDKLILDIENVSIHELSNLWGIMGGKYIPSILYRVRMLTVAEAGIQSRAAISSGVETTAGMD